jgi:hypothetical protein
MSKKQLRKQNNQIINNINKGLEVAVNDEQASHLFYHLQNGSKISFTGAIDEISNQINLYNKIVDEKNEAVNELQKLKNILINKDHEITTLKNKQTIVVEPPIIDVIQLLEPLIVEKVDIEIIHHFDIIIKQDVEYLEGSPIIIEKNPIKDSIIVPPKIIESSIFNENFKIQCINLKNDLEKNVPLQTIPLTTDNINLVEQLKCGIGPTKKKILLKHINNINYLDDLPKLKIGIGQKAVDKLKLFFHINNSSNQSSNVINVRVDDFNLPFDNEPIFNYLIKSIGKFCK